MTGVWDFSDIRFWAFADAASVGMCSTYGVATQSVSPERSLTDTSFSRSENELSLLPSPTLQMRTKLPFALPDQRSASHAS